MLIQLLLIIFFIFAIVKVWGRFKTREISAAVALGWTLFWLAAGTIVVLPNSTFYLARFLGIGRGADVVVYLSLAIIFFMLFRILVKIEHLNKDITTLTRELALRKDKEK